MDKDDLDFAQWLEKESQAMSELYEGMEPIPEAEKAPEAEREAPAESAGDGSAVPEEDTPAPEAEKATETAKASEESAPGQEDEPKKDAGLHAASEAEEEALFDSLFAQSAAEEPAAPQGAGQDMADEPIRPQMTARMPKVDRRPVGERAPRPEQTARMAPPSRETETGPDRSAQRRAPRPERPASTQAAGRRPTRDAQQRRSSVLEPPPGWGEKPADGGDGGDDGGKKGGRGGADSFWDKWKYALIAAVAVLVLAVGGLAVSFAMASRVAKLDTIYPNVTMNGVPVGGMTLAEAAQALGDPADKYDDAVVEVDFPTGDSLTVTAEDVGLEAVDGTVYAQAAYSYGRNGSLLSNWKTYRSCKAEPVELTYGNEPASISDETLTALVQPVAEQVNQKLGATQAKVEEDKITIIKRLGAVEVDVPAVCSLVRQAFETENYEPIQYEMAQTTEGGDEQNVAVLLQSLYDQVFVEPKNAEYDKATGGATQSVTGVSFDPEEARQIWDEAAVGETVEIPLTLTEPEITTEQLLSRLFADVLAEKSTSLGGSSAARINNITLAAKAMNGTVLQPGEQFDYNACLGERTASKGYQEAGAYSNGKHETAIGGGICQGSSTLYYCALYANLKITVRYDHYFLVDYLPWGMDATVSWGGPDFKFVNSRNYPIKIEASVSGGKLHVKLLGTDEDGSYVKITSETWEDSDYYYAQTYRKVYDKDGNQISSNKEAYSRYHKHEAATPTPKPTATAKPTEKPAAPPEAEETAPPAPVATPDPTPDPTPEPEVEETPTPTPTEEAEGSPEPEE